MADMFQTAGGTLDPGTGAPQLDVVSQMDAVQRRRALLDAMTKQNMTAPIVGNTGLGQMLAHILTSYALSKGNKSLLRDETAARQGYNTELAKQAGNFMDASNGKPAVPATTGAWSPGQAQSFMEGNSSATDPSQAQPAVAPNPRQAIIQAMTSNLPEVRELGKASMANMNKQMLTPQDLLNNPGFSAESRKAAAGMLANGNMAGALQVLASASKVEKIGDNLAATTDSGTAKAIPGNFGDQYSDLQPVGKDANGNVIQAQKNLGTNKYEYPIAGQTINIDNVGKQDALAKLGPALEGARNNMLNGQQLFNSASRAYQLSQDPSVTQGFGAGATAGLKALGAKLGLNGPEGVAKAQSMVTELAARTLAAGDGMKGSFSDADIVFLKQIAAGSQDFTPQAIQHVSGLAMAAAHNAIMQANDQHSSASTIPGAAPMAAVFPKPALNYAMPNGIEPGQPNSPFKELPGGFLRFDSPLLKDQAAIGKGNALIPSKPAEGVVPWQEYLGRKGP